MTGRCTVGSIGLPLPQRHNIVVTRDSSYRANNCTVANSIEDVLLAAGEALVERIGPAASRHTHPSGAREADVSRPQP